MRYGILKATLIIFFIMTTAFAAVNTAGWLSEIENNVLGVDYPKDTDVIRLQRVEKVLYGSEQKGTVESRIKKISQDTGCVYTPPKSQKAHKNSKDNLNMPVNQNANSSVAQAPELMEKEDSTVDYPIVDKMEQKVFSKTYKNENIYARLDRLEKTVFNSTSKDVLSARVEKLSDTLLYDAKTAQNDGSGYLPYPQQIKTNTENYGRNHNGIYSEDNVSVQLAALEKNNLKNVYMSDSVGQRISRLEQTMLGKTFPQDNPKTRVDRLMAVNVAQNNSSMYDNNKTMRNVATFSQIGGIILMILAMIL